MSVIIVLILACCMPAFADKFDKPWHIKLPRKTMLAAWGRLRNLKIPSVPVDMRFKITGAEYFVSPKGNDEADGSVEHPWRTLKKACAELKPNTVVYLKAGTYYGPVNIRTKATKDAPAAMRGVEGDEVIVTYTSEWVSAEKAKIAPVPEGKKPRDRALGADGEPLHYPPLIAIAGGSFVEVSSLHLVGVRDKLPHNLYSESGIAMTGGGGEGCRILYNEIEKVGHCGVKELGHGGHSFLIEGNYIHNLGHTFHDHGIYCPANDAVIRKNILINTTGWGVHAYSNPARIIISHNICAGNDHDGVILAGPDATVTRNVFYKNNDGGLFFFRSGCKNARVANNVFVEKVALRYDCCGDKESYPSGNVADYNCLAPGTKLGPKSPLDTYGPGNITANPGFTNAEAFDFTIPLSSPCVDAGDKTLGMYYGSAPDMGIVETGRAPAKGKPIAAPSWVQPSS